MLLACANQAFILAPNRLAEAMKTEHATEAATRRDFLRGGVRYALLAGLAAVSATVASRRVNRLPGQTCISQGICSGCPVFTDCGLPPALSAKQARPTGGKT
jgi:hypothetical protein